jgi:Protein of unknown function (DUF1559)
MPRRDDSFDDDRPRHRRQNEDDFEDSPRRKSGSPGLLIAILVGVFVVVCGGVGFVAYFLVAGFRQAAVQAQANFQGMVEAQESRVNLTEIGTAIHKYHDAHGHFPNNSYEERGPQSQPLLSWRVHILPQLGEDALYKQFKLDEPWDSPNNRPLLARMPAVYTTAEVRKQAGDGKTFYRAFSQPGAVFLRPQFPGAPIQKVKLTDIRDGTSNTLLVVEAGQAVEWTKPDDLDFGPGRPRPVLGGAFPNYPFVMVLMADGSVKEINRDITDQTLRLLITRADGQVITEDWEIP